MKKHLANEEENVVRELSETDLDGVVGGIVMCASTEKSVTVTRKSGGKPKPKTIAKSARQDVR